MNTTDTMPRRLDTIEYNPALDVAGMPDRIKALPVDRRGYPVPFFVAWLDDGTPDFRVADGRKWPRAIKEKLCWVCGEKMKRYMTFVAGPMCGINRTSAEPPNHLECASWSARNCPFLSKPQMHRRENDMPSDATDGPGFAIKRNPGVSLLWTTKRYSLFNDGRGGTLIHMGPAHSVEWLALGQPATRAQVEASIAGGLPLLEEMAAKQAGGLDALAKCVKDFKRYLPKE